MLTVGLVGLFALNSCSKNSGELLPADNTTVSKVDTTNVPTMVAALTEDFDSASKTDYLPVSVKLGSGSWYFYNAMLGASASDRKVGVNAVRLANDGKITMLFDKTNGVGAVQVKYALYGTDGNSSWELWISKDGAKSWTKVDSTINTTSTVLHTVTFTIRSAGNARFEIRKTGTDANHINIDDFRVSDYAAPVDTTKTPGTPGTPTPAVDNDNMMLGNPSNATADIVNVNNYWMVKTQYTLSYSSSKLTPNWTSWHLNSSDIGSAARQDDYRADVTLPTGWFEVDGNGYSKSGFDRGHMCPSADRTSSVANNSATFLMTNMVPQSPKNNEVTWENLESYSRTLVDAGNELYIISGPYGQGGTGSNGFANTTVAGVVIPAQVWKIIVVLPNGDNDLSRITTSTRVIAVLMPNNQTVSSQPWTYYRVSVDAIETLTGYDFLSNVPAAIQNVMEAKVDNL